MSASGEDIAYMSFFFIDIVGLSEPVRSTMTQVNKIRTLNRLISECSTFAKTKKDQGIPFTIDEEKCIRCGMCFEACKFKAVDVQ